MTVHRLWLPLIAFAALLNTGPARADDEPEIVRDRVDLSRYHLPAAPTGSTLMAPSDRPFAWATMHAGDLNAGEIDEVWREFGSPPTERAAFPADSLIELLRLWNPPLVDSISVEAGIESLLLAGAPEKVAEVRKMAEWIIGALGLALPVEGALFSTGSESRVLGAGATTLWPNRWTKVLVQETRTPFVVDYNLEIAQEIVAMEPTVQLLPEGHEVFLRYHPGETVSVVEMWAGELEHLDVMDLDLSELRNLPESSASGHVALPRTAIRRAYTAFAVPAGEGSRREVSWQGPSGGRRLALKFGKSSPPTEARKTAAGDLMAVLRVGAWAQGLEFESRASRVDAFIEQMAGGNGVSIQALSGGALLVSVAAERLTARIREEAARRERGLSTPTVALRTLVVPEEAFRKALDAGQAVVGGPLEAAATEGFRQAGAGAGEGLRLPVLAGMRAGFRVGASVAGLRSLDNQVAQEAGGLDPTTSAVFAGLSAAVSVERTDAGHRLVLDGSYTWADPRAGTMKLVFRPPVGVRFSDVKQGPESDFRRTVELPVLGDGRKAIEASIDFPVGEKREVLVAAVVRGNEVILVLASVEP